MNRTIHILAMDGVAGGALMSLVDLFATCNRIGQRLSASESSPFTVRLAAAGPHIETATGQILRPDCQLNEISQGGVVILPAPMVASGDEIELFMRANGRALDWLGDHGGKLELLATHCSGSFVLAEAGLLHRGPATTSWYLAQDFKRRYPQIDMLDGSMLIQCGNALLGGAGTASNDIALHIVERYAGRHFSRLLAKYLLLDNQRQQQAPYAILSERVIDDDVVARAERWIHLHLGDDFCIEDIAEYVSVSPRTLIRRFRKAINESPQSLTQKLRVEKSKILLETTDMPLADIMQRVGYNDESAFRRIFTRLVQLSPAVYRRRFNSRFSEREHQALSAG